ncbi:MAG TPA: D-alanyl carrier protein [Ruminococcaceae bacterium]|nr:D-alanyl carrier protein [Oscillospiraceae bacterium]
MGNYIKIDTISDDDNFFEKGLVNSLFAMQLVSFIEKEFGIVIDNDELDIENFQSINAVTNFIGNKLALK